MGYGQFQPTFGPSKFETWLKRHVRPWLARKVLRHAKHAHAWAAMQLIDENDTAWSGDEPNVNIVILPEHMRWAARAVIEHELDQVAVTGRLAALNQITEEEIVHRRLARRYDPGMALNEAFDRAGEKVEKVSKIYAARAIVPVLPGETLAEAQQRVVAAKTNIVPAPLPKGIGSLELSANQQVALKVQEEFLRKNAQTPKRPLGT